MAYLMTFHTHSGAIRFENLLRKNNAFCELMPVPRVLSSSCGVCAKFESETFTQWQDEDVAAVYSVEGRNYQLLYSYE